LDLSYQESYASESKVTSTKNCIILPHAFRTDSITTGFKKAFWAKPEALVVTISSAGGSLTQAKNIADILKLYSNQKK
jgi:hypothetical protein